MGQSKPQSHAVLLAGGNERLKELVTDLRRDTGSGVGEYDSISAFSCASVCAVASRATVNLRSRRPTV